MPANIGENVIDAYQNNSYNSGSENSGGLTSEDEDHHHYNSPNNNNNSVQSDKTITKPMRNLNNNNNNNINYHLNPPERYESLPIQQIHEPFMRKCLDEILKLAVFNGTSRESKVVEWQSPEELEKNVDFKLPQIGDSDEKLIKLLQDTIKYSVKTGHPYFLNQLFSCVDPYALIGQWLTDALNPSVYTYEVSGIFILMEEIVLAEMRRIVGFPNNGYGDGIFCPGGSIANGYAITCARFKFMPDVKKNGLHNMPRLVLFTSEDAHYSIKKMASIFGIGTDNVYEIKTDNRGKMDPLDLEEKIKLTIGEGGKPFMVSATAGTTVVGAFDPLDKIAEICEKYNLWMHVDAAWGGGALMSQKYKSLLKGIEKADSVTWNPHKMLAASQQCSTFLTKHKTILADAHSLNATYLFQKDKFYDTKYDTGDKHIQCGRRADVVKFWFMWHAKGTAGFEKHVDRLFHNAEYFTEQIRQHESFELVFNEPECLNISFWYIPPSLKQLNPDTDEYRDKLHKIAPKIKERMMKFGTLMITYQPLGKIPNFFRLVFQNSALNHDDMHHIINEIERLGHDL